jgi:hypothetical protein
VGQKKREVTDFSLRVQIARSALNEYESTIGISSTLVHYANNGKCIFYWGIGSCTNDVYLRHDTLQELLAQMDVARCHRV